MPDLDYKNHRKMVPIYHYGIFGILAANLVWTVVLLSQASAWATPWTAIDRVLAVLVALALIGIASYTRLFPLRVQDRLIRAEERERLGRLLPPDLAARAGTLSMGQLIALRFAADDELPELVRAVLDENIRNREQIKQRIKTWRPDPHRM
jgi:hypothetical protein